MSYLQAESFGALEIIILINAITQTFQQPSDCLEYWVYIDNKEVIYRINTTTHLSLTEYYAPEYELTDEIKHKIYISNEKGHWLWIESHTHNPRTKREI